MSGLEIIGAVGGVVATIASGYIGLVTKPLEKDVEGLGRRLDSEAKALAERIEGLHVDKKELERRIVEIEKNAVSRAEMQAVRDSIDKMGERVMSAITNLTSRVDHALDRVAQVEGRHG